MLSTARLAGRHWLLILAITDPKKNLSAYFDGPSLACEPAKWTWEQLDWELPWRAGHVKAFPTPGHSPGGISIAMGRALFTGDTFLGKTRSPIHLPGSNKRLLRESVSRILSEFEDDTVVYPGHGLSFTLGAFRQDAIAACAPETLEN
jgi:hydroxyacylglutathione hydrolase